MGTEPWRARGMGGAAARSVFAAAAVITAAGCPDRDPFGSGDGGGIVDAAGGTDAVPDRVPDAEVTVDGCEMGPPPCPPPVGGRYSVCGRVQDVETSEAPLGDEAAALEVRVCEAIDFTFSGMCTSVVVASLDRCGYFQLDDVALPGSGFAMLVVDDAANTDDAHLPTGVALTVPNPGQYRAELWKARRSTVSAWDMSASRPSGESFAATGVLLMIFRHVDGSPAVDVTPMVAGVVRPDDDFFFMDMDVLVRRAIGPTMTATGSNGSALLINVPLGQVSATSGEPGCSSEEGLGASVPGVVIVDERDLVCP